VDPGDHTFTFAAHGYQPLTKRFSFNERESRAEVVQLLEANEAARPSRGAEDSGARKHGVLRLSREDQRIAAIALASTGAAALALGAYFGLHAKSTYDDAVATYCSGGLSACTQAGVDGVNSAHTQATVATLSFVAAVLVLGGALTLNFLLREPGPSRARIAQPRPSSGLGLSW
jgi:hypothetical protein